MKTWCIWSINAEGKMRRIIITFVSFLLFLWSGLTASAQEDELTRQVEALPWLTAPSSGLLGDVAQIKLGGNLRFLGSPATAKFLELNGNPPRDNHFTLAPSSINWFAVFAFDASGYVRDDEKIDPDTLLRQMKERDAADNEERRRLNLSTLRVDGWAVEPHYDVRTRQLEWATRLIGESGNATINYTIRLLGRSGVMRAILVSDPEALNVNIQEFRNALAGFSFVPGQGYTEFRAGDRVAEYGLAALVVGGAAAVAAKSGLFKILGKFAGVIVLGGLAAVVGFFRKMFRRAA